MLGIIIPIDYYFSEGFKPPTRIWEWVNISNTWVFGDEHNQISILRWTEEHQGYENAPRQQAVEVDENIAYHSPCRFPENESEPHSIWRLGLPESIDMFLIHVEFLVPHLPGEGC